MADYKSRQQLIAAVAHELLKVETFATFADFSDAIKTRCAALRIPYQSLVVSEAMRQVCHVRKGAVLTREPRLLPEVLAMEPSLGACEARTICRDVMARLRRERPVIAQEMKASRPEHFPDLVAVR